MSTVTIDADDDVAAIIEPFRAQLRDPAKPLSLLVRSGIAAADGQRVEAVFGEATSLTLREPAASFSPSTATPRDPGRFVVYEQWRSLLDLEAHLRTDYVFRLRAELEKLIVGMPEFQVLLPAA